jgi:hypothetical protein
MGGRLGRLLTTYIILLVGFNTLNLFSRVRFLKAISPMLEGESKLLVSERSPSCDIYSIGVDDCGVDKLEEEGHPCSEDCQLGTVIRS